jgi:hypothetical protein
MDLSPPRRERVDYRPALRPNLGLRQTLQSDGGYLVHSERRGGKQTVVTGNDGVVFSHRLQRTGVEDGEQPTKSGLEGAQNGPDRYGSSQG